jgi:hypothetical protein
MKNSLIRIIAIVLGLFSLVSCDKDFNSIGSDVLGDDHFDLEKYEVQNLVAYTKPTGAVQSNNLPVNGLGIYENPAFGTTTAHFVTQLELTRTYNEPEKIIGENFTFNSTDSVYLYVPYFATDTKVVDENTKLKIYELDSIYGDLNTTFDLKIYENGYYLNDFSAAEDFQNSQKHYTDEANKFDSNVGAQLNTSSDIYQNTSFKFNSNEIVLYKSKLLDNGTYVYVDEDGETLSSQSDITVRIIKERMNPGMWINLDKNILKDRILEASLDGKLYNNNVFKEYFKGLYFKTQQTSAGAGAMAMLDFSKGYVVIQYHSDITTTDSDGNVTTTNTKRKLKLTFGGNTVNLLNHSNAANYQNSLNNSNNVVGNDRLYIKGNNGSMAFIDLFGADDSDPDDIPEELENLRANNWLINDAFLIFYVDKTAMSNSSISEPNRILLFDATNNKPLLDYTIDTSVSSNSKKNKYNYGGIVELEDVENGRAVKYKVRITNQIRNIINSEDDDLNKNIRLGLCVTENINLSSNAYLKTPISIDGDEVKFMPIGNVINPLGTILYGNNVAPADEAKKLKLQIFYTKLN